MDRDEHRDRGSTWAISVQCCTEGFLRRLTEGWRKGTRWSFLLPHTLSTYPPGGRTIPSPAKTHRRVAEFLAASLFAALESRIGTIAGRLRRRFDIAEVADDLSAEDRGHASSGACAAAVGLFPTVPAVGLRLCTKVPTAVRANIAASQIIAAGGSSAS